MPNKPLGIIDDKSLPFDEAIKYLLSSFAVSVPDHTERVAQRKLQALYRRMERKTAKAYQKHTRER